MVESTELQIKLRQRLHIPEHYFFTSGNMGRRQAEIDGLWLPTKADEEGASVFFLSYKKSASAQYDSKAFCLQLARFIHSGEFSHFSKLPFLLVALSGDTVADVNQIRSSNCSKSWAQLLGSDEQLKSLTAPMACPQSVSFASFSLDELLDEVPLLLLELAVVVSNQGTDAVS